MREPGRQSPLRSSYSTCSTCSKGPNLLKRAKQYGLISFSNIACFKFIYLLDISTRKKNLNSVRHDKRFDKK